MQSSAPIMPTMPTKRIVRRPTRAPVSTLLVAIALVAIACGSDGDDPAPADGGDTSAANPSSTSGDATESGATTGVEAAVTYYEHVKPMLDARCVACHQDGAIGPFALDTYEDAATWSGAAVAAVHAGTMPPWPPAAGCNEYVGARDLTDDEIAMLDAWVEAQTPMGDPALEGAPYTDLDPGLTRVDLTLEMPGVWISA